MRTTLLLLVFSLFVTIACAQNHKAQIAAFREKYKQDFLDDARSPLKNDDLQYLRFYDADSTYRVTAKVQLIDNGAKFTMPTFNGSGSEYTPYAHITFTLKGKPLQLTVYRNTRLTLLPSYKDYLFLPFTDETNGKETYGGGRYIDLREGDFKDGLLVLDFNKAYNPYCAFGGGYACPKPPDENHLNVAIRTGEKEYAKKH